jgi:DNA-binding MarR family transcriptional regulator
MLAVRQRSAEIEGDSMTISEAAAELIRTDPALAEEVVRQMSPVGGGLTPRQSDALRFIREYLTANGITPTYDEIAPGIGLRSKAGVHRLVSALEERGHITRMPGRARSIALNEVSA